MHLDSNDILYHYCSIEALYGILDSQTLRLTRIRYMNDNKEFNWIFELARRLIWQKLDRPKDELSRRLYEQIFESCNGLYIHESFIPNFYCSCFSRNGDSLSQWRAYADDGKGVAIGFDRSFLESFVIPDTTRLEDVKYLADADTAELDSDLQHSLAELESAADKMLDDRVSSIATRTISNWSMKAPFRKNAAFREEEEVRLVHMPNLSGKSPDEAKIGPLQFFHRNSVIVPCKPLHFNVAQKPISRIVLGPRNRMEHNITSIMELGHSRGMRLALDQFDRSAASYGEIRRVAELPPRMF